MDKPSESNTPTCQCSCGDKSCEPCTKAIDQEDLLCSTCRAFWQRCPGGCHCDNPLRVPKAYARALGISLREAQRRLEVTEFDRRD